MYSSYVTYKKTKGADIARVTVGVFRIKVNSRMSVTFNFMHSNKSHNNIVDVAASHQVVEEAMKQGFYNVITSEELRMLKFAANKFSTKRNAESDRE